jgi:hypothetical protein
MGEDKAVDPLKTISRVDLRRQDAIYFIGLLAATALEKVGQVTLLINAKDRVAIANPLHVYLDAQAMADEEDGIVPPFHYVRPILGEGRPQAVAFKDGELWEICFDEAQPEEPTGG